MIINEVHKGVTKSSLAVKYIPGPETIVLCKKYDELIYNGLRSNKR